MAEDYVRMGIAEAEKILPPEPFVDETFTKKIMVLGGGVTGLSAALEVAKAGYEAVVIEKGNSVGGFATKMRKQTPSAYPYEQLQARGSQLIREAETNAKIEIRTGTEIARLRAPGLFDVTLSLRDEECGMSCPRRRRPQSLRNWQKRVKLRSPGAHPGLSCHHFGKNPMQSVLGQSSWPRVGSPGS